MKGTVVLSGGRVSGEDMLELARVVSKSGREAVAVAAAVAPVPAPGE